MPYPDYLNEIANYETQRDPLLFSRDVGIICGTFEYYKIYDADSDQYIATTDTNYYVHTGLYNEEEYCYYISAYYTEGESDTTATVCATPETYVPDPVTNLSGAGLDEEALIYWTSPTIPEYVYYTSFEDSAAAGFTGQGGFEIGEPDYAFGPEAGSGASCWGTNLIGTYECTVDNKGRIMIPAQLKKQLDGFTKDPFILKRSVFQNCLELFPYSEWKLMMDKVNKLNRFVKKNNDFIRMYTAGVKSIDLDSTGRLLVPKDLIAISKLTKNVVLSSSINIIEIWDKDEYEKSINDPKVDFAKLTEEVMGNDQDNVS